MPHTRSALDGQQCVGCAWHELIPSPSSVPFSQQLRLARFSVLGRPPPHQASAVAGAWLQDNRHVALLKPRPTSSGMGQPVFVWGRGARTGGRAGHGTSCRVDQSKGVRVCLPSLLSLHSAAGVGGQLGPHCHLLPPDSKAWPHFSQASSSFLNSLVIPWDSRVPPTSNRCLVQHPAQCRGFLAGFSRP